MIPGSHIELLAPAGNMEKLEAALRFGADAVYLGGKAFGLRSMSDNFTLEELRCAIDLTHAQGKKIYLTLNAFMRATEEQQLTEYLEELRPLALDAFIVSDPGVLSLVRRIDPKRPLHLSTQANTMSAASANFWQQQGIGRVNLARELTLEEIRTVGTGTDLELEVFVHGAMCVAFSGRCLLSAALNRRSANRGACTQPCRWNYALVEESRPDQAFSIEEDERGSYLLNSRDLCLIRRLPELINAGASSLKIEGRMKGAYYVAAVVRIYRAALDRYLEDPEGFEVDPLWLEELGKVSHRPYDEGFLSEQPGALITPDSSAYLHSHEFVGAVLERRPEGRALIQVRNRIMKGQTLELIGPGMRQMSLEIREIWTPKGAPKEVAQPNDLILLETGPAVEPGDLLRRDKRA